MSDNSLNKWIACDDELPFGIKNEIECLVTCREWNIFEGRWGEKEIRILSYSVQYKEWNTKSDIKVEAWMYLPMPY